MLILESFAGSSEAAGNAYGATCRTYFWPRRLAGLHVQRVQGRRGVSISSGETTLARIAQCRAGRDAVVTLGTKSSFQIGISSAMYVLPSGWCLPARYRLAAVRNRQRIAKPSKHCGGHGFDEI
ncbi:hypothetical protein ACNKHQ_10505 [Shigella flexneri]